MTKEDRVDLAVQWNKEVHLSTLISLIATIPIIRQCNQSRTLWVNCENGFAIYCNPGYEQFHKDHRFPEDNNVGIYLLLTDKDGREYPDHFVDFVLTFDLIVDLKNYRKILMDSLFIFYPYIKVKEGAQ